MCYDCATTHHIPLKLPVPSYTKKRQSTADSQQKENPLWSPFSCSSAPNKMIFRIGQQSFRLPMFHEGSIQSKITFIMSSVCAWSWTRGSGEADCMGDPTPCDASLLPFDCPSFPVNPLLPRSTRNCRGSKLERRGEPDEDMLPCAWAWSRSCCCWGVSIWKCWYCCGACKKDFCVDTPNPGRSWSMPCHKPPILDITTQIDCQATSQQIGSY
jgi:hypothetical protein